MRIKNDSSLQLLADAAGITAEQMSEKIIKVLTEKDLIEFSSDCYGERIEDCFDRHTVLSVVVNVIREIGINYIKSEYCILLMKCILMGDGDCPVCGGTMNTSDAMYCRTGGDGYITPPEYDEIYKKEICNHCGFSNVEY